MSLPSSLYVGSVDHRRFRPVSHHLRYRMFWLLLDLDGLDGLDRRLSFFAHNRFNLFSFHDRDHGDGDGKPIGDWVRAKLDEAGISPTARISLLCLPRILGYGFNPLSIYFCYGCDGGIDAVLYEVHNTFGERHSYLVDLRGQDTDAALRHAGDKRFHVSPFMDMQMRYAFRVDPPGERMTVAIKGNDEGGPLITAALSATRRDLSDGQLLRVFATHPLLTLKVIGAIHWHALRLWWKGVGLRAHPLPPEEGVTKLHPKQRTAS